MENSTSPRFTPVTPESFSGHLLDHVECSYGYLVSLFGEPNGAGDGYKVSTEWVLRDRETGSFVTIYDWKETDSYDPTLPTVARFRSKGSHKWHIGGLDRVSASALQDFIANPE